MRGRAKEDITVVAELTVTSPLGSVVVRSFDRAWRTSLKLPRPVNVTFNSFVRLDD